LSSSLIAPYYTFTASNKIIDILKKLSNKKRLTCVQKNVTFALILGIRILHSELGGLNYAN